MRRDDPRSWPIARDKDGNAYIRLPNGGTPAARKLAAKMGVRIDNGIIALTEQTLLALVFDTMKNMLSGSPSRYDRRRWVLLRRLCTDAELEQVASALGAATVPK